MNLEETKKWLTAFKTYQFMPEIAEVCEFAIAAEKALASISEYFIEHHPVTSHELIGAGAVYEAKAVLETVRR